MKFNSAAEFETQAAHSAQFAMSPGWYAYTQNSVRTLENEKATSAIYSGLRARVGSAIQASGFKPARHELTELLP